MTSHIARHIRRAAVVLCVAALGAVASVGNAAADPDESSPGEELTDAVEDYIEALDELEAAEERQDELEDDIVETEERVVELTAQVNEFAVAAYLNGRGATEAAAILGSSSPEAALDRISSVEFLGDDSARAIDDLVDAQDELADENEELAEEIEDAEAALDDLEEARDAAADAMAASGGNSAVGPSPGDFPAPEPAPRNSDGSLPGESCSVQDPTPANGCITPRTHHALKEAQFAGFTRYVSCYRSGGSGEHPKGRACDFSAQAGGFGGDAYGDDKTYGDNLAAWLVENYKALGVKYVIWYRMFWSPASGWKSYSRAYGDPSSDHTNHVHLSML